MKPQSGKMNLASSAFTKIEGKEIVGILGDNQRNHRSVEFKDILFV